VLSLELESSCNPFFIHGGVNLGLEKLQTIFSQAGIGNDLNFIITYSSSTGSFPSRARKYQTTHQRWNIFDTALISIGQGPISTSPLQAAMFTAAIANGGTLYQPYLVQKVRTQSNHLVKFFQPQVLGHLDVSPATLETIHKGMHEVIHGAQASAGEAQTKTIDLAGKTGTAEVGKGKYKKNNTWFICFGPYKEPKYAMAVLIEDGSSGGKTAAPLARRFFELYLNQNDALTSAQTSP
jgi:penicillin-binding protein 2